MVHKLHLDIYELVGSQIVSTAEWRRGKVEQFPDDWRNLKAADELDRLAAEIHDLEGSEIHRQIDELELSLQNQVDGFAFAEDRNASVSQKLRGIGFNSSYDTGLAFLELYKTNL